VDFTCSTATKCDFGRPLCLEIDVKGTKKYYSSPSTPAPNRQQIMRFSNIATAVALLLTGASALDKPLNIEVLHAVECSTKTKEGK
jgi:hypothetical protein